jgi:hypothetical protein
VRNWKDEDGMIDLDTLVQPLRTPLVLGSATLLCILSAVMLIITRISIAVRSREFFDALVGREPGLVESLGPPSVSTRYGPIYPSRMSYLKEKRFESLSEVSLRDEGRWLRRLLTLDAIAFVVFIVLVLLRLGLAA